VEGRGWAPEGRIGSDEEQGDIGPGGDIARFH